VFSGKPDEKCFGVKVYQNRCDKTHFTTMWLLQEGMDLTSTEQPRLDPSTKTRRETT
jgi:hypothetical protein